MGMSLSKDELLPGEDVVLNKNVNAIIRIDEHGLSRFAFDHVMNAAGLRGVEALGGQLHLTNYRLVFKSHSINRVKGVFSIFLPTLREVRNTSSGVKRQIGLATGTQQFTFIVWGIPALIANHPIAGTAPTEPGDLARSGVSLAGLSSALNLAELQQLATGAG